MSCAPVKEEFNYIVNYSSECFTRAYLIGLPELFILNHGVL